MALKLEIRFPPTARAAAVAGLLAAAIAAVAIAAPT